MSSARGLRSQDRSNLSLLHSSVNNMKENAKRSLREVKAQKQPSAQRFKELAKNLTKRPHSKEASVSTRTEPTSARTPQSFVAAKHSPALYSGDLRSARGTRDTKSPIQKKSEMLFKQLSRGGVAKKRLVVQMTTQGPPSVRAIPKPDGTTPRDVLRTTSD